MEITCDCRRHTVRTDWAALADQAAAESAHTPVSTSDTANHTTTELNIEQSKH